MLLHLTLVRLILLLEIIPLNEYATVLLSNSTVDGFGVIFSQG